MEKYTAETDAILMIFGGDMNTPSYLGWGEESKKMFSGLVVPCYSTKVLEELGSVDLYQTLNTDPIKNPGITWHTKGKNDDHQIDYIFFKGPKLTAI